MLVVQSPDLQTMLILTAICFLAILVLGGCLIRLVVLVLFNR